MHPALTASTKSSLRSAFAQVLGTASENKERCIDIRPGQCVRDSDRLRPAGEYRKVTSAVRAHPAIMKALYVRKVPSLAEEANH